MTAPLTDRSKYAALDECVYLNQASLGLVSQSAVSAMHVFLDDVARHGNWRMSDTQEVAYADVLRERGARLLHTDPDTIAVVSSASELLGQVPVLLQPRDGNNVLLVSSDFPALTRPWLLHAPVVGLEVRFVDDHAGDDLTGDLIDRIDGRTAAVAVSCVQYGTGSTIDIPRLRDATTAAGCRLIVDASQAAGAVPVDVDAWQADVVVTSGYKWLGGHGGVALASIGAELLERSPFLAGWMSAPEPFVLNARQIEFARGARRYTQSTMSYVSVAGLVAALDEILAVGEIAIESHARQLADTLIESVREHGWQPFRSQGDPARSSHIVSLRHPTLDASRATEALRQRQIVCGTRGGGLRVSVASYNESSDLARLVEGLAEITARSGPG